MTKLKDVNVLLVGGTGHGKSFFVNMFEKVSTYHTLEEAENHVGDYVIPVKFVHEGKTIVEGVVENGGQHQAKSQTREVTAYEYLTKIGKIRMIDTPGLGDTDGFDLDKEHIGKIVSCMLLFKKIDAILVFLKATDNRLDLRVKYQLCELLSCFGKTAVRNIHFIITHAGIRAEPGEAHAVIQSVVQEIGLPASLTTDTYCFENDALRYLVLKKQEHDSYCSSNLKFFKISYENSVSEYIRLFTELVRCPQAYRAEEYRAFAVARRLLPRMLSILSQVENEQKRLEQDIKENELAQSEVLKEIDELELTLKEKNSSLVGAKIGMGVSGGVGLLGGVLALVAIPFVAIPLAACAGAAAVAVGVGGATVTAFGVHHISVANESETVDQQIKKAKETLSQKGKQLKELKAEQREFEEERTQMEKLQHDIGRCLHENSVAGFISAQEQYLEEAVNQVSSGTQQTKDRSENLANELSELRKRKQMAEGSSGNGERLISEHLLKKVIKMRKSKYYGKHIQSAFDKWKLESTTNPKVITRNEVAHGYMFDKIAKIKQ